MCRSTLLDFDSRVDAVVTGSLMRNPSLVKLAINDDGSVPCWATNRSKQQLCQLLFVLTDEEMDSPTRKVINDFMVGSIGLAEALDRWRTLSLPAKLRNFVVKWQASVTIYINSRAGMFVPA